MARVSAVEGIRYGIALIGYTLGIAVFGTLLFVVGAVFVRDSPALGAIIILVGIVTSYAGIAGTLYKIIADAVAKGNDMSDTPTATKVPDTGDSDGGSTGRTSSDEGVETASKVRDSG
jgi:hypothetical protein